LGIIIPFTSVDGVFVLIDAGGSQVKAITTAAANNEVISGIIRLHKKGRGFFDNANDEAGNTWYWWDLSAMQAAAHAPTNVKIAPFIVQRLTSDYDIDFGMKGLPVQVELTNNHLGYAITWFGLASALVVVAGFFALDRMKREG
jgi:surfeit locus 1 family protein